MLLNRYVDLTEAIDEGNASLLDNSDFAEATNVPLVDDGTLPTKQVGITQPSFPKIRPTIWWLTPVPLPPGPHNVLASIPNAPHSRTRSLHDLPAHSGGVGTRGSEGLGVVSMHGRQDRPGVASGKGSWRHAVPGKDAKIQLRFGSLPSLSPQDIVGFSDTVGLHLFCVALGHHFFFHTLGGA